MNIFSELLLRRGNLSLIPNGGCIGGRGRYERTYDIRVFV